MSVQDKFEYTKVIINLKSKDRQYHRQNKQKNNKTIRQTISCKTLHKTMIEQQEAH
jgi:major membrane immunogen (membrane-anchored lipoprotein)